MAGMGQQSAPQSESTPLLKEGDTSRVGGGEPQLETSSQQSENVLRKFWSGHGQKTLEAILAWPTLVHVTFVIFLTWFLGWLHFNALFVVLVMVVFLWKIHDNHLKRERHQIRMEIYKEEFLGKANTPDDETTRWLNMVMERAWPEFLERLISLHMVPQLAPWFLNTYKPAVLTKLELKGVNMGSQPPVVTCARVYQQASDSNHVELEMSLNITSSKDMFLQFVAHVGTSWAGVGLIPWTAYATDLNLFGRARVGLRFSRAFPFVDAISVSFVEQPDMTLGIKVMGMGLGKGFDAGGLPLVADYVKTTLTRALGGSLVAPNRLVIEDIVALLKDVVPDHTQKDAAAVPEPPPPTVTDHPVATVHVEILQGEQLIAADTNGLSDPYVKGTLGPAKFVTSIKKSTLNPKWMEDFEVPVMQWQDQTLLRLLVRDYDRLSADDDLGLCEVDVGKLRDGKRHEMWISLENVKRGKILVAITVHDESERENVNKTVQNMRTSDGDHAQVEVKTLEKDDGHVASASAVLKPSPRKQGNLQPSGPPGDKLSQTNSPLTTRKVALHDSTRKEVAPGVVVVAWDA